MKDSITRLLQDLSARLDCDVLDGDDNERELSEKFSDIRTQTVNVADEIRQFASTGETLTFATDLSQFLDRVRARALKTQRLKDSIAEREGQITEAQKEFRHLSAGRSALAAKVNNCMLALEQAKSQHAENELKLGVLERRVETDRREAAALRRRLSELSNIQEG